jgi:hypothetical protein
MIKKEVYIKAAAQISMQQPLSEAWMQSPIRYDEHYVRSIEPNYREFIHPMEARRMGKILKRALTTSLSVIRQSNIEHPDAIITGTGLGCIDNTEQFLGAMCRDGEQLLKPTPFMQSTHNTISSLIAISTKCHGYNATYSHRGISFESALFDAMLQFWLGKISTALVGSHDELTPDWYTLFNKVGYAVHLAGEASVSFMLAADSGDAWCRISSVQILHSPSAGKIKQTIGELAIEQIDAVMSEKDELTDSLFENIPLLHYKHLFGESYSASAFGVYAAACCLKYQHIPSILYRDISSKPIIPSNILFIGRSGTDYSFIFLKAL